MSLHTLFDMDEKAKYKERSRLQLVAELICELQIPLLSCMVYCVDVAKLRCKISSVQVTIANVF